MIFEFKWPDDAAPLIAAGVVSERASMVRFVVCPDREAARRLRASFQRRLEQDAVAQDRPLPTGIVTMSRVRDEEKVDGD